MKYTIIMNGKCWDVYGEEAAWAAFRSAVDFADMVYTSTFISLCCHGELLCSYEK